MNDYDKKFINIFNECYPFERYIIKEPKSIGNLFDDAVLTEIFIPYTEIKPILDDNGGLISFTKINQNDVYVKLRTNVGEIRFCYFDFAAHIRENIRDIFVKDFGQYEYECLYVDHENEGNASLIEVLNTQKALIKEKYGECHIKTSLRDNLVNE
jgi:hypothetical protein